MKSLLTLAAALCLTGCVTKSDAVKQDTQPVTAAPTTHESRAFTADFVDEGSPMPPGMSRKVTVVGERVRTEQTLDGKTTVQIYRGKGQPLLVLDPAAKTWSELPSSPIFEFAATAMDVPDLQNPCAAWRSACARAGDAELEGRKVAKWTTTTRDGKAVTLYVDESLFHLLRIEEGTAVKTLKNVTVIAPDEALFAVPSGFTEVGPTPAK